MGYIITIYARVATIKEGAKSSTKISYLSMYSPNAVTGFNLCVYCFANEEGDVLTILIFAPNAFLCTIRFNVLFASRNSVKAAHGGLSLPLLVSEDDGAILR